MNKLSRESFFFILILLSVFIIFSCNKRKDPIYIKYSHEITNEYLKYMSTKHKLTCSGFGGSYMFNVEEVMLALDGEQKLREEQGRVLFVTCAEELLQRLNQSEKIRPYLDHYPFRIEGIKLSISFHDNSYERVNKEYVAYISLIEDNIHYYYYDAENDKLITFLKEPYSEALKKVREAGLLSLSEP